VDGELVCDAEDCAQERVDWRCWEASGIVMSFA